MPLPRALKIAHAVFSVRADREEAGGHGALGVCFPDQRRIVVRDDLPPDLAREILVHETLHAAIAVCGADLFTDEEAEEAVVRALSGPLLDLIRRNPAFVEFLRA